jgi:cell division protein FtsN
MAQRGRRRGRSSGSSNYPGWLYGLFGLAIGLAVAAAVWFSDRRAAPVPTPVAREPASMESALDQNGEAAVAASPEPGAGAQEPKKSRFDFYEMLPAFEVEVTEEAATPSPGRPEPSAVVEPGLYVLQAGSFSRYADADRRRAELALQGIESNIQKVTIGDKTYHRVNIGPTDDLNELNMLRSRLRAAKIDVLRIRMGD